MNNTTPWEIDPALDLVLEREIDVPRELVWKVWTEPQHLMQWFCPLPWKTIECAIDLRPVGEFMTVIEGPEGQSVTNLGCFLEVLKGKRLVWTSALLPNFRPMPKPENGTGLPFTAIIQIDAQGKGSKYTAIAIHKDAIDCKLHEKMGFYDGWGKAFDQLTEMTRKF
jgi:uncharacterized protein YndB with AHSA1/START domain